LQMDFFIGLTAFMYLTGAVLGYLKGQGSDRISDQFRHQIINAAFIWHTVLILWPIWQFKNYPFVTSPYERIVMAWAIIGLYQLWTKKYNLLILEIYILFSGFFLLLPVSLMEKLSPEIISTLWLAGGGLVKHLFIAGTIAFMINTIILELSLPSEEKEEKKFWKLYIIGLVLWVLALGTNYYWLTYVNARAVSAIGNFSTLWAIALTLFMLVNLYVRKIKRSKFMNYTQLIRIVISFMVITLFAVAFGM